MEIITHKLLAEMELAAPLLARFDNGLRYKLLPGHVCTTHDLVREPVWRAVAARLGELHAKLPLSSIGIEKILRIESSGDGESDGLLKRHFHYPNIWTVLQKWTFALPAGTDAERSRKASLQAELKKFFHELYREGQEHDDVRMEHSLKVKPCI